jgi:hypothetical protein
MADLSDALDIEDAWLFGSLNDCHITDCDSIPKEIAE